MDRPRKISRDQYGFTLVEVLIAIMTFSIGLLGVAQLMVSIINSNLTARHISTAATLAQDKMEDIHRVGYGGVDALAGTENYHSLTGYAAYKRVTAVTANTPGTGMKTVTVSVFWDGDAGSTALSIILAE